MGLLESIIAGVGLASLFLDVMLIKAIIELLRG
jgi:hypothetical protein